jgi:hypothetical protein
MGPLIEICDDETTFDRYDLILNGWLYPQKQDSLRCIATKKNAGYLMGLNEG